MSIIFSDLRCRHRRTFSRPRCSQRVRFRYYSGVSLDEFIDGHDICCVYPDLFRFSFSLGEVLFAEGLGDLAIHLAEDFRVDGRQI